MANKVLKGFIKNYAQDVLLPITRGELVVDAQGKSSFHDSTFLAKLPSSDFPEGLPGLMSAAEKALLNSDSGLGIHDLYNTIQRLDKSITLSGTNVSLLEGLQITVGDDIDLSYDEEAKNWKIKVGQTLSGKLLVGATIPDDDATTNIATKKYY